MITPKEATQPTREDTENAVKHEAHIDGLLRRYDGKTKVIVNCTERVAGVIAARYRLAGWAVKVAPSTDQCDPGYLFEFTIPSDDMRNVGLHNPTYGDPPSNPMHAFGHGRGD